MKKFELTRLNPTTKEPIGHGNIIVSEIEMRNIFKTGYGKKNFSTDAKEVASPESNPEADEPKSGRQGKKGGKVAETDDLDEL